VIWVLSSSEYIDQFDKLLVLDKGKVMAEGTVAEVKSKDDVIQKLLNG